MNLVCIQQNHQKNDIYNKSYIQVSLLITVNKSWEKYPITCKQGSKLYSLSRIQDIQKSFLDIVF